MTAQTSTDIQSTLNEQRVFDPPPDFSSKAHIKSMADYERLYEEADRDPEAFWGRIARRTGLVRALDEGARMGCAVGEMVRRAASSTSRTTVSTGMCTTWRKNKAAIIWEGEPGEIRTLTYQQLHSEVSKFANVLKSLGVKKGDRVAIYMGMSPGTRHRPAGLRAHRRAAHRDLRRLFLAGAGRPHQRFAGCRASSRRMAPSAAARKSS